MGIEGVGVTVRGADCRVTSFVLLEVGTALPGPEHVLASGASSKASKNNSCTLGHWVLPTFPSIPVTYQHFRA